MSWKQTPESIIWQQAPEERRLITSNSFASKYCKYCWGRISLKPSKNACVCSSTPRDNLHSATILVKNYKKRLWASLDFTLNSEYKNNFYKLYYEKCQIHVSKINEPYVEVSQLQDNTSLISLCLYPYPRQCVISS